MYVYLLEAYYFLTETERGWICRGGAVGKKLERVEEWGTIYRRKGETHLFTIKKIK